MFRTDRRKEGSSRDSEISFSKVTWGMEKLEDCSELFPKESYINYRNQATSALKSVAYVYFQISHFWRGVGEDGRGADVGAVGEDDPSGVLTARREGYFLWDGNSSDD